MNLWPLKQLPLDQPASFCRERTTTIIMTREQFRIKSMRGPMNANKQNQKMGKAMEASQGHCGDSYLRIYICIGYTGYIKRGFKTQICLALIHFYCGKGI